MEQHSIGQSENGLGHYTGVLAVDVRRFSSHDTARQQMITDLLPSVLRHAADRAEIPDLVQENSFRAFRGDGYLIGLDSSLLAAMVDRFFDALQDELRERAALLRPAGVELRLRASLHAGPLRRFNERIADSPSGTIMVEAGRMVDAEPVRALLDRSDPEVTLVACVLSEEVMKQVVEAGWTTRRPSEFVAAPLQIEAKDYSGTGYLRVPVVSGDLLRSGLSPGQPAAETSDRQPEPAGSVTNTISKNVGTATQAHTVHGGVRLN